MTRDLATSATPSGDQESDACMLAYDCACESECECLQALAGASLSSPPAVARFCWRSSLPLLRPLFSSSLPLSSSLFLFPFIASICLPLLPIPCHTQAPSILLSHVQTCVSICLNSVVGKRERGDSLNTHTKILPESGGEAARKESKLLTSLARRSGSA